MIKEIDDIDIVISNLLSQNLKVKRIEDDLNTKTNNILDEVVDNKIEQKTLPLALRKRLMYQRVLSA